MQLAQTRRHFAEIDSTNTYALAWPDAPDGALVVADAQTAGRGRLGRAWQSEAGVGLYFSLVLRALTGETRARLSLLVGLAVAVAVERVAGLETQLKWPNDILARGHKIGGILCEANADRIVAGVGLNLNQTAAQLPERPLFPASSLLSLAGRAFERDAMLEAILGDLERELNAQNWPMQRERIEARLWGRGELVKTGGAMGLVRGIGDDGALLVQTADGLAPVRSGEVELI